MKRFVVVLVGTLVACALGTLTATAAPRHAVVPPRAELRGFVCHTALDPSQRSISIEAVMRPVQGTKKLDLRFDLLSRSKDGAPYTSFHQGDLGTWQTPPAPQQGPPLGQNPADVWQLSFPVTNLPAPAQYHYRVTFRWIGAHDHVLAKRTLPSRKCYQPELRPDLLVASITIAPIAGKPKLNRYSVLIRNDGLTAAGPFNVLFAPPSASGAAPKTRAVAGLAAHASQREVFDGPACAGSSTAPTVTVDPNDQVDDFKRANNSLTVPDRCPVTTTAAS